MLDNSRPLHVAEQCSSIERTFQVLDGMLVGSDSTAELKWHINELHERFSTVHERLDRL